MNLRGDFMALEMRDTCENCTKKLHNYSIAYICTHECTFCRECTEEVMYICPNCGGELAKRPRPRSGENRLSCSLGEKYQGEYV